MITLLDLECKTTSQGRRYLCPDGNWVPSVTTVIGASKDFSAWEASVGGKEVADGIRDAAAAKGNRAHANAEAVLNGWFDKRGLMVDEDDPYLPSIHNCLRPYEGTVKEIHTEVMIWHPKGFAGRLDVLRGYQVLQQGKPVTYTIHDFKTKEETALAKFKSSAYREKALADYWEQMAAYSAGVAHCFGILVEGAMVELLFPNGKYMSFGKDKNFLKDAWGSFKTKLEKYEGMEKT